MYLSQQLVSRALRLLEDVHPFFLISFLTAKRYQLPVGQLADFPFGANERLLLDEFYKPIDGTDYYFRVSTAGVKGKRWVDRDYNGNGSQKTRTTTFVGAFHHIRGRDRWGWRQGYVDFLSRKLVDRIPAFFLAVWLYRRRNWNPSTTASQILREFFREFHISKEERHVLFDEQVPQLRPVEMFRPEPMSWEELRAIIGPPPDAKPAEGATLKLLRMKYIGPALEFEYLPADRMNLITGDNSLGKTFILECVWWALTGEWLLGQSVEPRRTVAPGEPRLEYKIGVGEGDSDAFSVGYDWLAQRWEPIGERKVIPGLVVYARYDGSFAIWDPARSAQLKADDMWGGVHHVFLSRTGIWTGATTTDRFGRDRKVCNGLLADWVSWQRGGSRFEPQYQALLACLKELSPSPEEPLSPGEPMRLPLETQEVPSLQMPYGEVPVTNASAGVQRAIALAYVMVWAWHEHVTSCLMVRQPPQSRLVIIVDEVEAHLHPRWQRMIVPALMKAVAGLSNSVRTQLHLATHSPLVMASTETMFDEESDDLHHLKLSADGEVALEELPYVKRGRVDRWLMSEVFGLGEARSLDAENAIAEAKVLQAMKNPSKQKVAEVSAKLLVVLAPDDDFWPRWQWFAEKHGVES